MPETQTYDFQIVIPAYNEAEKIGRAVEEFHKLFKLQPFSSQLILVLNGCTDSSLEVARSLEGKYSGFLRVLNFPEKLGKGGAVLQGFASASAAHVCFADADCAVPPSEILKLYKNIDSFDCIIGSRYVEGSHIFIKQSLRRRVAGRVFNLICKALFGFKLQDTQCGGKIFTREAVSVLIDHSRNRGWAFDVELLSILNAYGYSILEYPIDWYHDDNSKIHLLKDGFKMLGGVLGIFMNRKKKTYSRFLFHQHYYLGQGTYKRAEGFAREVACRNVHVTITCTNDRKSLWPEIVSDRNHPYIDIIKLPRITTNTTFPDLLYRLPFATWFLLTRKYEFLFAFALGVPTNSIPSVLVRFLRRVPVLVDWDDLWFNGYGSYTGNIGNFILGLSERTGLRLINPRKITTVSTFLKDQCIRLGFKSEDIEVIPNGVIPDGKVPFEKAKSFRDDLGWSPESKYLISVGNTYGKSFLNLIEAFKKVHETRKDIYLLLLGDFMKGGALGEMIEEVIRNNRSLFLTHIRIMGKVPWADYEKHLIASDGAILPMEDTDIDRARFPIRFCDYVKYHCAIVSNATGEVREIMARHQLGLMCDVADLDALAGLIPVVLDSSDEIKARGDFDAVLAQELNWEENGRRLKRLIHEMGLTCLPLNQTNAKTVSATTFNNRS